MVVYAGMKSVSPSNARTILADYWQHTKVYPALSILVLVATFVVQAGQVIAPIYLGKFLDLIAANRPSENLVHALSVTLAFFAFFTLLSWAARRVLSSGIMRLEVRVMADIENKSFAYLIGHSYHFFISHFAGSLVRRVARYKRSYEVVADAVMLQILPATFLCVGIIAVLWHRHPTLGVGLAAWTIFFITVQFLLVRRISPLRLAASAEDSKTTGVLADAVGNHPTITLFAGATYEKGLFAEAVERLRVTTLRSWLADDIIWAVQGFLMAAVNIGLLWGAMLLWQRGVLSVGDFALLQTYLLTLFERLVNIGREMRHLFTAFADASEMSDILAEPHTIRDAPSAKTLMISEGAMRLRDVEFRYGTSAPILSNFNLSIAGGEKIAFVGPSGGGKSTITKLLLRLYDVSKGSIEVDGQDISRATLDSLRENIAFVPQEPVLFHRTLLENIRYGRRDATEEEVIEAARRAHCHEFIERLPQKYDTYVGERGVKLSGGERQRIAIARAILKNAPVLVLDEATSSLDSESEMFIQDALARFMEGKTVVVIAHRLSTIMKMDRIVVIEGGAIVAEGPHEQLLHTSSLYQKLWSIQAGGFLREEEI